MKFKEKVYTIHQKKLSEVYQDDVWNILCNSDKEFIPPLSERNSTTLKSFSQKKLDNGRPVEYFKQMLKQEFILALVEGKAIGFISFTPDYLLQVEGKEFECDYITTVVVSPEFRGRGITREMYHTLFENRRNKNLATRTWSTNYGHLYLLDTMGFKTIALLPNDRIEGIDTIYFLKVGNEDE
jgi:ribosomal protein S18 acetylase RimI-like enzyme